MHPWLHKSSVNLNLVIHTIIFHSQVYCPPPSPPQSGKKRDSEDKVNYTSHTYNHFVSHFEFLTTLYLKKAFYPQHVVPNVKGDILYLISVYNKNCFIYLTNVS